MIFIRLGFKRDKNCEWYSLRIPPPPIHLKVKRQCHSKVKNVHNRLSHGDTPICQNLVCLCKRAKTSCQTQTHGENIILILKSNRVKVIQSSRMYATYQSMVIHSLAKQRMTVNDWLYSMVAYFCHHLSDNYVDLSDLYIDLSVIYVDLSDHYVDLSKNYQHN